MTEAFPVSQTVISQYANSPIILSLIANLADAIDQSANLNAWYDQVWNIDTAVGYGLDVWGRILVVKRVLRVPVAGDYLGFEGSPGLPFDVGTWYGLGTSSDNFSLPDDQYRRLLLAKAALNITDCSIPAINQIILALFPSYGNSYVRDDGGMAMTYVFGAVLSAVDYAIVTQSGVLPKPVGVAASAEFP